MQASGATAGSALADNSDVDTLILGGALFGSVGVALVAASTMFTVMFKLMGNRTFEPKQVEVESSSR